MQDFFQTVPQLQDTFHHDPFLKTYLETVLPKEIFEEALPSLEKLGADAKTTLLSLSQKALSEEPIHIPYGPWGERIDEIKTSQAWKELETYAAEQGIVATAYERKFAEHSRLLQAALLYLYHPSSAFFSCPLAMTDGAARAIELYGDEKLKARAFKNLTSRNPQKFWTSGQWMTEKTGGSDVAITQTRAVKEGDHYRLYGTKWFTSATTAQMAMTLARIDGAPAGSKGLSLFYLELRDEKQKLNNMQILRLKDKMGTKALPTAEIKLDGTKAILVGGEGDGIKKISSLFNVTRVYNSICALGQMRRSLDWLGQYSKVRVAFGQSLANLPLHQETLSELELLWAGNFLLVFETARLLGLEETNEASDHEKKLLRMLTPIAKLYSAKCSVHIASETVEGFGGAGYCEDTGIPTLLKDAQVLAIWEGTTNVLSLDLLRAGKKEDVFSAFAEELQIRMKNSVGKDLQKLSESLKTRAQKYLQDLQKFSSLPAEEQEGNARHLSLKTAKLFIGFLFLDFANKTGSAPVHAQASQWLEDKTDSQLF